MYPAKYFAGSVNQQASLGTEAKSALVEVTVVVSLLLVVIVVLVDDVVVRIVVDVVLEVDDVDVLVVDVEVVVVRVVEVLVVVVVVVDVVVVEFGSTMFTSKVIGQIRSIRVLFVSLESSVSLMSGITGTSI